MFRGNELDIIIHHVFVEILVHEVLHYNDMTTVATCGAETAYPSGTSEFNPGGVRVARSLVFCVMFCRSELFVLFLLKSSLQLSHLEILVQ
jgi:hypothetical protein